jgi:hypothetical protein
LNKLLRRKISPSVSVGEHTGDSAPGTLRGTQFRGTGCFVAAGKQKKPRRLPLGAKKTKD